MSSDSDDDDDRFGYATSKRKNILNKPEEIDGNSYIKQYYLQKYGSAKKGFDPHTELKKKRDLESSVEKQTPLQPKRLNYSSVTKTPYNARKRSTSNSSSDSETHNRKNRYASAKY